MYWMGGLDLIVMVIQRMFSATTPFPLLAIPFFILAGNIMNSGGMTHRIFDFAQVLVGRVPGALGHVNVVSSMVFAGMSGSAVADAAGLGTVQVAAMRKAGYPDDFSAAITAVSSTIGPIIPPSIPFVIYGSLANVSVGALFLAGVVPGILMGLSLMVTIAIVALRREFPQSERPANFKAGLRIILGALPAVLTPVILIGGMLVGLFTPTEAAVVASLYALLLGAFGYRELRARDLPPVLWETATQTIQVMFIIASAGAFGWILIQQSIPDAIVAGMLSISKEPWVLLLLINIILLILGMFLEAIAIMIIVLPIFMPMLPQLGVSPVHFGVILVLNLMIGLVTPPVGLCLYVVSSVSGVPLMKIFVTAWPYIVALIVVLGIITYVPPVVMWLPKLLMGAVP
jgi:tripartite ATP-independent transporter DctM subunit